MIYFITNQTNIISHEPIKSCNIQYMVDYFKDKREIQADTETEGFFDHKNRIISLQLRRYQ